MYKQLLKTLKNKESLSSTNGPFNGIITSFLRCYNNLTNGIIKYRTYGDISNVKLQCLMSFNIFYRIEFVSLICINRTVVVLANYMNIIIFFKLIFNLMYDNLYITNKLYRT